MATFGVFTKRQFLVYLTFFVLFGIYLSSVMSKGKSSKHKTRPRELATYDQADPEFIRYVKQNHMSMPSSSLSNFINSYTTEGEGQPGPGAWSQTQFVLQLLNNKAGIVFEARAFDGEKFSNTVLLEAKYGWTGILVEPSPVHLEALRSKHRKAFVFDTCLSTEPHYQKGVLYNVANGRLASVGTNESLVQVPCLPIYSIMKSAKMTKIEYFSLSLSIEKTGLKVLETIPFGSVFLKVFSIEVVPETQEAVTAFMVSRGYRRMKTVSTVVHVEGDETIEVVCDIGGFRCSRASKPSGVMSGTPLIPTRRIPSTFEPSPVETAKILVYPFQFEWKVSSDILKERSLETSPGTSQAALPQELAFVSSPSYTGTGPNGPSEWVLQLSTDQRGSDGHRYLSLYLLFKGYEQKEGLTQASVIYSLQILLEGSENCFHFKQSRVRHFDSANGNANCFGWLQFLAIHKLGNPPPPVFSIGLNLWILDRDSCSILDDNWGPGPGIRELPSSADSTELRPLENKEEENDGMTSPYSLSRPSTANSVTSTYSKDSKGSEEDLPRRQRDYFKELIAGLWVSKQGWDLEVRAGNLSFQAHFSILTARSSLLARELPLIPLNEDKKRVYRMDDVEDESLAEVMLEYSYTGTTGLLGGPKMEALYKAATKYEMRALRAECVREMTKAIPPNKLVSLLGFFSSSWAESGTESLADFNDLAQHVWHYLRELKRNEEFERLLKGEPPADFGTHYFLKRLLLDSLSNN